MESKQEGGKERERGEMKGEGEKEGRNVMYVTRPRARTKLSRAPITTY